MLPGSIIDDRFVLEQSAGSGGMGAVFRARDREGDRPVAVKLLSDYHDPESARRFDQEARVLADMGHPDVVRYLAHGITDAGQPYLVMEWLEGESLAARLAREPLRLSETLALAARVARALGRAHARGVVHRDIKPSNLFLVGGRADDARLLDFGIAQSMSVTRRLTATGVILGTPGYMAPEQANGDAAQIGPAADVFSLGAVLFECLTGRPAFEGRHVMSLLAQLLLAEMPRVRDVRPDVPAAVDALVARMLARDVSSRLSDGSAVAEALAAIGEVEERERPPVTAHADVITTGEMRILSIAAIAPFAAPEQRSGADRVVAAPESLLSAIREMGIGLDAEVHALLDGSILLWWVGAATPTDQAARAAHAALQLRALRSDARVALVTGRAQADAPLPVGETVERAARLLEAAAEGAGEAQIPIDESTRALLEMRFDVVAAGADGLLRGEREVATSPRTLLGRPSHFVGRDRELRHARELLEEGFAQERALSVVVIGAAGMGKSRLRHELLELLRRENPDMVCCEGRADSMAASAPLSLLGSVFRGTAGIAAGEPLAEQRRKLVALVERHVSPPDQARVAAFLGELTGIAFPDDATPRLAAARQDPSLMGERVREAYVDFVAAAAAAGPALLVLEDLHWADAASVKLVEAALRALHDRPFAVLGLARPEVHDLFPKLWDGREVHEIRLGTLPKSAAEALVRRALGPELAEAQARQLVERAAGNAFYLEELIRAVAEGRGAELPDTVLGMVEARLLSLEPEARRLLRAASVFGETFWAGGVLALLGGDPSTMGGASLLASLVERELVVRRSQSRFAGEEEYMFRHALLREGSYAMLTERDRAAGHRAAAEWLVDAGEQSALVLAQHFDRGGEAKRAIPFYAMTAEQALVGVDHRAALSLSDRALALGAEGEDAAALRSIQSQACWFLGDLGRAHELTREVLKAAAPGTKSHVLAIPTALVTAMILGKAEALAEPLEQALRVEPAPEIGQVLCMALHAAMSVLLGVATRPAAEAYLRRVELVASALAGDVGVQGWLERSAGDWAALAERDPWGAIVRSRASRAFFEQIGDGRPLVYMERWEGIHHFHLGAFEEAEDWFERALEAPDREPSSARVAGMLRAVMHAHRGDFERARQIFSRVEAQLAAGGDPLSLGVSGLFAAEIELRAGAIEAAARLLAERSPGLAAGPRLHAYSLTLLARVRLEEGRPVEATLLADEALGLGEAAGLYDAHSHAALLLVHAEALRAAGRAAEADAAIRFARADLLGRAARVEDPEARRGFLERLPDHARTLSLAAEQLGA